MLKIGPSLNEPNLLAGINPDHRPIFLEKLLYKFEYGINY